MLSEPSETPETGVMTGWERKLFPGNFRSLLSLSGGQSIMCQWNLQDTHGKLL